MKVQSQSHRKVLLLGALALFVSRHSLLESTGRLHFGLCSCISNHDWRELTQQYASHDFSGQGQRCPKQLIQAGRSCHTIIPIIINACTFTEFTTPLLFQPSRMPSRSTSTCPRFPPHPDRAFRGRHDTAANPHVGRPLRDGLDIVVR